MKKTQISTKNANFFKKTVLLLNNHQKYEFPIEEEELNKRIVNFVNEWGRGLRIIDKISKFIKELQKNSIFAKVSEKYTIFIKDRKKM